MQLFIFFKGRQFLGIKKGHKCLWHVLTGSLLSEMAPCVHSPQLLCSERCRQTRQGGALAFGWPQDLDLPSLPAANHFLIRFCQKLTLAFCSPSSFPSARKAKLPFLRYHCCTPVRRRMVLIQLNLFSPSVPYWTLKVSLEDV